jgi:DNA-binding transcriptional MerR regulator
MDDQGLVAITKAARMIGVHPNTLRSWADKGLVDAVRLPSGYRRFTMEEIHRIRRDMGLQERPPEGKAAARTSLAAA